MKKIIFFDTETTGLPLSFKAEWDDIYNWPRIVQLAWMITDFEGRTLSNECHIIKPEGFKIPDNMIHGISHEQACEQGVKLESLLKLFLKDLVDTKLVVAHNYAFDAPILNCELIRTKTSNLFLEYNDFLDHPSFCTKENSTPIVRLPGTKKGTLKWPSLKELYHFCFDKEFYGAHNALHDVTATKDCFFFLEKKYPNFVNINQY
jgi:DNA polymerase III epsilon subunit-like protein